MKKGFTIIETFIVVAIISILVTIYFAEKNQPKIGENQTNSCKITRVSDFICINDEIMIPIKKIKAIENNGKEISIYFENNNQKTITYNFNDLKQILSGDAEKTE